MNSSTPAIEKRPLLSVCLIVRDEAHHIERILRSVLPVADDIVVVDTGSVDQTPDIAAALGARVLHSPWKNDFSEARNVAMNAARGIWILNMDADQRLDGGSLPALRQALKRKDCLAQTVTFHLHAEAGTGTAPFTTMKSLRLVRNDARIRYRGRVHEDVAESLLEAGSTDWPDSGVVVDEFSYVDAGERARKRARNLSLLHLACAEEPDAVYPAYKLALTLLADGNRPAGRAALYEALSRLRRLSARDWGSLPFLPGLVSAAVGALGDEGRLVDAVQLCREFEPTLRPTLDFTTGTAMARAGCWDEARQRLQAWLASPGAAGAPASGGDAETHPARACLVLAWIERMNGHLDEATGWVERGRALAGPEQEAELMAEALEIQLLCGALVEVTQGLDALAALVGRSPSVFPKLMALSARLAHQAGDLPGALELARSGQAQGDDACAALLASLEIEAGVADEQRLRQLHDAIAGRQVDTLAVKLLIGRHLGIEWPHAVPDACRME